MKITFFLPYMEMKDVVCRTFLEQQQQGEDEWQLETVLKLGTQILGDVAVGGDVVIARGATYRKLKQLLRHVPVTELKISGYDIMRAALACKKESGEERIGYIGTTEMIYGARHISELIPVQLVTAAAFEEDGIRERLLEMKEQGVKAVIGGVTSTIIARKLGFAAVRISSGREAVYQALVEAKRAYYLSLQERRRAELFRAILNYTSDGIIAVNKNDEILLINREAANITGLSPQSTGKRLASLLPRIPLRQVVETAQPVLNRITRLNDQDVTLTCVPMQSGEQTIGAVAAFQPVLKVQNLGNEIRRKKNQKGHIAKAHFDDILGESPALLETIHLAKQYSKADANVLINGETGTGKELFAQSIHNASSRSREPFVAVNCAVLSENLLESELFGYVEGAFTDARKGGKSGLFEAAHHGTLFLDEIAEISPRMQGLLLRVLQEHEIMRVGDDRIIPVDVRVIAATNRNLAAMSREGKFRLDLYYRLNTLHLVLPPLRDRGRDVLFLFRRFLSGIYSRDGIIWKGMTKAAEQCLLQQNWAGNIRELYNVAERVAVFTEGAELHENDLRIALSGGVQTGTIQQAPQEEPPMSAEQKTVSAPAAGEMDEYQRIRQVLEETHYHYGHAAAQLGISRTTLWRKMKQMK